MVSPRPVVLVFRFFLAYRSWKTPAVRYIKAKSVNCGASAFSVIFRISPKANLESVANNIDCRNLSIN